MLVLISTSQIAQTPSLEPGGPVIIKAGFVHTNDSVINDGMILIENGEILSIGKNIDIPESAKVQNYDGMHVYPAFIHARSLVGLAEIWSVPVTSDFNELGDINPNVRAEVAFNPGTTHLGVAASYGIAIVVSTPINSLIAGQSAALYTDGWTWEQMTMQAPVGLIINWPSMINNNNAGKQIELITSAFDDAKRYLKAKKANKDIPKDIRWESMISVIEGELPVYIHANEISEIQSAISWAESEGLSMVLTGGRDAAYLATQLAEKEIPVIITPVIGGPARQWEHYGASYARVAKLYEAGVKFAIAGDLGAASAYRLPYHAASAVAFGLPEEEALKAITLYPAEILGIDNVAGSIDIGKNANLIISDGNPVKFSTQIKQVYVFGKKIDMNNKHQKLFEKYQKRITDK